MVLLKLQRKYVLQGKYFTSVSFHMQSSSFIMEEDQKTKTCGIKKIKEAFSVGVCHLKKIKNLGVCPLHVLWNAPFVFVCLDIFLSFSQMVGSVLYFTSFCVDKLGQPLLNDNPQQTEGWEVPKYPQHCLLCSLWTALCPSVTSFFCNDTFQCRIQLYLLENVNWKEISLFEPLSFLSFIGCINVHGSRYMSKKVCCFVTHVETTVASFNWVS